METSVRLKKVILNSIQNLTIHGLPNIFKKDNILIKLWWLLLTIVSIFSSILFIRQTLLEYYNYNVITEIRINEAESIEFPIITMCNVNKLSTDYSLKHLERQFDVIDDYDVDFEDLKFLLANSYGEDLLNLYSLEEKQKFTKSKEMIKKCKFIRNKCTRKDFEWLFNSRYGNCIRFNSNSSLNVKKTRIGGTMINSLFIELDVSLPYNINQYELQKGIYLSIDDKHTNPFDDIDDVILIRPGLETSILIEKSSFIKYPRPYSKCDFRLDDFDSINHFKKKYKYFREVIDSNYSYSQSTCIYYCIIQHYISICNCTTHVSSIKLSNMNFCRSGLPHKCYTSSHFKRLYYDYCQSVCPLECNKVKYFNSISNSKVDYASNDTTDDIVYLSIYFGSMSYIEYKETPSITIFGLVSNLGGTLGIFLG
jgi:hypothetical protein